MRIMCWIWYKKGCGIKRWRWACPESKYLRYAPMRAAADGVKTYQNFRDISLLFPFSFWLTIKLEIPFFYTSLFHGICLMLSLLVDWCIHYWISIVRKLFNASKTYICFRKTNTSEYIKKSVSLPEKLFRFVTGEEVFSQIGERIKPLTEFPQEEVNEASKNLINNHISTFVDQKILMQVKMCIIICECRVKQMDLYWNKNKIFVYLYYNYFLNDL